MRTRRRKLILLALVLVFVLGLCAILVPSGPPDPIYDGKHLSYWMSLPWRQPQGISSHYTVKIPLPAMDEADSNAIPFLVATLRDDNTLGEYYQNAWQRFPGWLQTRLPIPSSETRKENAFILLRFMEDKARPAIPALADILKNPHYVEVHQDILWVLPEIGKGDSVARQALIDAARADPKHGVAWDALKQFDPVAAAQLFNDQPSAALTNAVTK